MNILVSNLGVSAHKNHLQNLFLEFGNVRSVNIVKGSALCNAGTFCLVIIDNYTDAVKAIRNLDQTSYLNKIVSVRKAFLYPKQD